MCVCWEGGVPDVCIGLGFWGTGGCTELVCLQSLLVWCMLVAWPIESVTSPVQDHQQVYCRFGEVGEGVWSTLWVFAYVAL